MRNGKRSENTTSPPFLSRVLPPLPRLRLLRRLSLKNARLPFFFFLDSNRSYWDLLFPHRHNLCKNTSILGRTVLKISLHGMPQHHYTNSPYGFHSFHSVLIGRTCLNNSLVTSHISLILMTWIWWKFHGKSSRDDAVLIFCRTFRGTVERR